MIPPATSPSATGRLAPVAQVYWTVMDLKVAGKLALPPFVDMMPTAGEVGTPATDQLNQAAGIEVGPPTAFDALVTPLTVVVKPPCTVPATGLTVMYRSTSICVPRALMGVVATTDQAPPTSSISLT